MIRFAQLTPCPINLQPPPSPCAVVCQYGHLLNSKFHHGGYCAFVKGGSGEGPPTWRWHVPTHCCEAAAGDPFCTTSTLGRHQHTNPLHATNHVQPTG